MTGHSFHFSHEYGDVAAIHDALYNWNLTRTGGRRTVARARQYPEQQAVKVCDAAGTAHGGLVFHWRNDPRRIAIDYLYLDDTLRGGGVGAELMKFFLGWAKAYGAARIDVMTNDFQAPGFYCKMGFEILGSVPAPQPRCPDNRHYSLRKIL